MENEARNLQLVFTHRNEEMRFNWMEQHELDGAFNGLERCLGMPARHLVNPNTALAFLAC